MKQQMRGPSSTGRAWKGLKRMYCSHMGQRGGSEEPCGPRERRQRGSTAEATGGWGKRGEGGAALTLFLSKGGKKEMVTRVARPKFDVFYSQDRYKTSTDSLQGLT